MQKKVFYSINSSSTLREKKKGRINETQKWVKQTNKQIIKMRGKINEIQHRKSI